MKKVISVLSIFAMVLSLCASLCLPAMAAEDPALTGFSAELTAGSAGFTNLYDKTTARPGHCKENHGITASARHWASTEMEAVAGETIYFGPCNPQQTTQLYFWSAEGTFSAIGASGLTLEGTFDNGQTLYSYTFPAAGTFCTVNEAAYNDVYVLTKQKVTVQGILNAMTAAGGNLYSKALGRYKGYVNTKDSTQFASNENHNSTYAIAVTPGETVTFGPAMIGQTFHASCFDENMALVSGLNAVKATSAGFKEVAKLSDASAIYSYTIPEGVSYIRIVNRTAYRDHFFATQSTVSSAADFYALQGKDTESPLFGKNALYAGDSITAGARDALIYFSDSNRILRSTWGGRIAERNDMTYVNNGVSGTSVSTVRGATRRIINQLQKAEGQTFDYVILHGGVNDAWDDAPVGTFDPDSFDPATFDTATYAGGLEETIYTAIDLFGDTAAIGYIVNFASPAHSSTSDSGNYFEIGKAICEKWDVDYLDLSTDEISAALDVSKTTYLADKIHPSSAGYDILTPYIESWMETLTPYDGDALWQANIDMLQADAAALDETLFTPDSFAAFKAAIEGASGTLKEQNNAMLAAGKLLMPAGTLPITLRGTNRYYDIIGSFSISTPEELNYLATLSKTDSFSGETITLTANLDMSGTADFAMIGSTEQPFKGTFDGQGKTISNLTMDGYATGQGMFVDVVGGTLKNFTLDNAKFTATVPDKTGTYFHDTGLVAGEISGGTLLENIHVTRSNIVPTLKKASTYDVGLLVGTSLAGTTNRIYNCSVTGSKVESLYIQGVGGIIGRAVDVDIEHCAVIDSVFNIRMNSAFIAGYAGNTGTINAVNITDCFTYGNTISANSTANDNKFGTVFGQVLKDATVKITNGVFYETSDDISIFGQLATSASVPTYSNVYVNNTRHYLTSDTLPDTVSVFTADLFTSGFVAYSVGLAMKDGKLAFADEDTLAAKKHTYLLNGEVYAVRYTDSTGAMIGTVADPEVDGFDGWTESADGTNGDKLFTYTTADVPAGPYPLSQYEAYPNAKEFTISSPEELNLLATLSKSNTFAGYTFTLIDDIDMSATADFAMIGDATYKFAGTFDGQGNTITGLTVATSATYNGMFRYVTSGTIKNLTLSNTTLKGGGQSGILIGEAVQVTVDNVHIAGANFTADGNNVGGIIGRENASQAGTKITNCSVDDLTFGSDKQGMGGIIGYANFAEIESCYVINSTISSRANSGLLIGYALNVSVDNCFTYNNTLTYLASKGASANNIGSVAGQAFRTTGDGVIVTNSVFCEDYLPIVDYIRNVATDPSTGKATVDVNTVYSIASAELVNATDDSDNLFGTTITQGQITSGEVSYLMGWALENGKLAFTDEDTLAAKKYTYKVEGQEDIVRHTDSTGAIIGEAVADPAKAGYSFDGWTETTEENGDKTFTASFTQTEIPNDLNGNGAVGTEDVILLMQYLNNWNVTVDAAKADISGDGKVSIFDAVKLLQIINETPIA